MFDFVGNLFKVKHGFLVFYQKGFLQLCGIAAIDAALVLIHLLALFCVSLQDQRLDPESFFFSQHQASAVESRRIFDCCHNYAGIESLPSSPISWAFIARMVQSSSVTLIAE